MKGEKGFRVQVRVEVSVREWVENSHAMHVSWHGGEEKAKKKKN
jgi:hypothetical protein